MTDQINFKQRAEQALQNCREARANAEEEKKLSGQEERPSNEEKKYHPREERRLAYGEKLCPFSFSNPNGPMGCTANCKLYRSEKVTKDYECTFSELRSNSWNTKEILKLIINYMRGR